MIIQNVVIGTLFLLLSLLIYLLYYFFYLSRHPLSPTNPILPQGKPSSLSNYLLHRHTVLQYRNSQLPYLIYQIFTVAVFVLGLLTTQKLKNWSVIFGIILVLIAEVLQTQILNKRIYILIRLLISSSSVIMLVLCGVYMINSYYLSGLKTIYSLLIMWSGDQFIIRPLFFLIIYLTIYILNKFSRRQIRLSPFLSYVEQQEQYRKFRIRKKISLKLNKPVAQYIGNQKHIQIESDQIKNKTLNNTNKELNECSNDLVLVESLQKQLETMNKNCKMNWIRMGIGEEEGDKSNMKKIQKQSSFQSIQQDKLKQCKEFKINNKLPSINLDNILKEQNKTHGMKYSNKKTHEQQRRKQSHSFCSQNIEIQKYQKNHTQLTGIYEQSQEYVENNNKLKEKKIKKNKHRKKKKNINKLIIEPSSYLKNIENLVKPEQKQHRKLILHWDPQRRKFNTYNELQQLLQMFGNENKMNTCQQNL